MRVHLFTKVPAKGITMQMNKHNKVLSGHQLNVPSLEALSICGQLDFYC